MAGFTAKKRSRDGEISRPPKGRPVKKRKSQFQYHSSDSEDADAVGDGAGGEDFPAVNLLDSDEEDLENMVADDGASVSSDGSSDYNLEPQRPVRKPKKSKAEKPSKKPIEEEEEEEEDDNDEYDLESSDDEMADDDDDSTTAGQCKKKLSKRNDATAFATSMAKILGTKLSASRRADPVLARSAEAQEASRRVADSALEAKARRKLAEDKRVAQDKGRVKDVLLATNLPTSRSAVDGHEETTTSELLESERRLRKVAQRGVIKLFNAVRAAQVKASEAERANRAQGVIGMGRREEKVAEMSKKGFLDLIAAGGGGLKKGPMEEA